MRVCPECRKQYADDVEACPDDGMALMEAQDRPVNPELRDVVPVSPTDHTAMIDLEAIEAERERRGLNRPTPTATHDAVDETAGEEEEPEERRDPDATGTFHVDDFKRQERERSAAERSALEPRDESDEDDDDEGPAHRGERTQLTRVPRGGDIAGRRRPERDGGAPARAKGKGGLMLVAAIAGAVVVALGLSVGVWWYVSSRGAVLTVTSVPPGATVLLDGKELGKAPLQDRVAIGSHVVEISLEGYKSFKEVVDVPAEGLPFLQPLEADPNAKGPAPAPDGGPDADGSRSADPATNDVVAAGASDGGPPDDPSLAEPAAATADVLIADFDRLLGEADYEAALGKIKELVTHHPDDKRAGDLFTRLADARIEAATTTSTKTQSRRQGKSGRRAGTPSAEEKKQEARDSYAAGEALYREGGYAEARAKFQRAIQLDPRYPQPHRAIARLYERENDVERTRYHLDRYLRLGGRDPDYRVRRWLEDNKDK